MHISKSEFEGEYFREMLRDVGGGPAPRARSACSPGQVGVLNAESFCERVISQANLVMTSGTSLLSDEEMEMLVILRMNREFMKFMREHYADLSLQDFKQTTIDLQDNAPDD